MKVARCSKNLYARRLHEASGANAASPRTAAQAQASTYLLARDEASGMLQPAVHRTILIVDVESFGNPARTDLDRVVVRDAVYHALQRSFSSARINWADCAAEDRGDGVFVLLPRKCRRAGWSPGCPSAWPTRWRGTT